MEKTKAEKIIKLGKSTINLGTPILWLLGSYGVITISSTVLSILLISMLIQIALEIGDYSYEDYARDIELNSIKSRLFSILQLALLFSMIFGNLIYPFYFVLYWVMVVTITLLSNKEVANYKVRYNKNTEKDTK